MANTSSDHRSSIYQDLHHHQMSEEEEANHKSARLILTELFRYYSPKSALDIGCGFGTWLEVSQQLGVKDILGIEGSWLDRSLVCIPQQLICDIDLEQPFDLKRRFDLVICLEVAEHLSPAAAAGFVESMVRHGDLILFSAAIPFQGGHHHVNEQFLDYWSNLFQYFDYRPVDFLRPIFWQNPSILWWLRQNLIVFAKNKLLLDTNLFGGICNQPSPLSIVHPDVYLSRIRSATAEYNKLISLLSTGNSFELNRQPDGQFSIIRTS